MDETGSAAHVSCDVCDRRDAISSSDIHARAWVDNKQPVAPSAPGFGLSH